MLLLLTYRLTWASTSGSFVGHVCRGWMPKDREDLAFHRRVCAIWLPQDPFVRGSISGPGGCSAVLKQRGWERHWEQRRTRAQCWPVWPLLPGGQPIVIRGEDKTLPRSRCPTKTAPYPYCTLWHHSRRTIQILSHPLAKTLQALESKVQGGWWVCEPSQAYLEKRSIRWGRESSIWSTCRAWTSWPSVFSPGVPGLSPSFQLKQPRRAIKRAYTGNNAVDKRTKLTFQE